MEKAGREVRSRAKEVQPSTQSRPLPAQLTHRCDHRHVARVGILEQLRSVRVEDVASHVLERVVLLHVLLCVLVDKLRHNYLDVVFSRLVRKPQSLVQDVLGDAVKVFHRVCVTHDDHLRQDPDVDLLVRRQLSLREDHLKLGADLDGRLASLLHVVVRLVRDAEEDHHVVVNNAVDNALVVAHRLQHPLAEIGHDVFVDVRKVQR